MTFVVGDGDDRIVERRLDVYDAVVNDALLFLLEALLLTGLCRCFSH